MSFSTFLLMFSQAAKHSSLYHSARLRWNSIDRLRSHLQDALIDEVAEWCVTNDELGPSNKLRLGVCGITQLVCRLLFYKPISSYIVSPHYEPKFIRGVMRCKFSPIYLHLQRLIFI
jgi:hypothetical protein